MKEYDYSTAGHYFITICVKDRHEILGRIIVGDAHLGVPAVELSETGLMVAKHIDDIAMIYENIRIDKYVVMPNHVHMIVVLRSGTPECASPTKSALAKCINALKSLTSRQFGETMWQRSYHDHIIRNEDEYRKIWQYIDENPVKWTEDRYYRQEAEYLTSSISEICNQNNKT